MSEEISQDFYFPSLRIRAHLLQRLLGSVANPRVGAGQRLAALHSCLRRLALTHENQTQSEVGFQAAWIELSASL